MLVQKLPGTQDWPHLPLELIEQILGDLWCTTSLSSPERTQVLRSLRLVNHGFRKTITKLAYTHVYISHPNYVQEYLKTLLVDRFLHPLCAQNPRERDTNEESICDSNQSTSENVSSIARRSFLSPNDLCKSITITHDLMPLIPSSRFPFPLFNTPASSGGTNFSTGMGSTYLHPIPDLFFLFMDSGSTNSTYASSKRKKAHNQVLRAVEQLSAWLVKFSPDYVPNLYSLTIEFVDARLEEILGMQRAIAVPEQVKQLEIRFLQNVYGVEVKGGQNSTSSDNTRRVIAGDTKKNWMGVWKEKVLSQLGSLASQFGRDPGQSVRYSRDSATSSQTKYSTHWCIFKQTIEGHSIALLPISIGGDSGEGRTEYSFSLGLP